MNCQKCNSDRVLEVTAKACDMHFYVFKGEEAGQMYAAEFCNSGDYTEFKCCMECGQMQGEFPRKIFFENGPPCDGCENPVDECTCPM